MRIGSKARLFWPLLVAVLLADCTTKEIAVSTLEPYLPREVIGTTVRFTLAFNPSAALSLPVGPYGRFILSGFAVIIVAVLFGLYRKTAPHAALRAVALGLVTGGALGNLVDRLRSARGVVDFIDVGIGQIRFWTFNVADIGVTVGAVLLAWALNREATREEAVREPTG